LSEPGGTVTFVTALGFKPLRVFALLLTSSSFGVAVALVTKGVIPSLTVLLGTLVPFSLFLLVAGGLAWLLWRKKARILPSADALRLVVGTRLVVFLPWVDIESITETTAGRLPVWWRGTAFVFAWRSRQRLADIRLRRMTRQAIFKGGTTTTRGLGLPAFTKHVYLAPLDIDAFVSSAKAHLIANPD